MSRKVVVVATGGTIASRFDPQQGRVVTAQTGEGLVKMIPGLSDVADVEVKEFASIGSFQLTLDMAFRLTRFIDELCARTDVAGVVVTHGTDTLEETSYLADLLVSSEKPVVFTGAQRSNDDPETDGPRNLLNAIRAAAVAETRGLGAVVCFDDELHAARDVTKLHTSRGSTFKSPGYGMLGEVDQGMIIIHRRPALRRTFRVTYLETGVDLIKLALGTDSRFIDTSLASGAVGIVLEAFGRGNANTEVIGGVKRATEQGVPVVVTSRCPMGRVYPIYGGGGGKDLQDAGAVFAGDLSGVKARLLLMVLLSDARTKERIEEIIHEMVGDASQDKREETEHGVRE